MIDLGFADDKIFARGMTRRDVFEKLLIDPLTYQSDDVVLIRLTAKGSGKRWIYEAIEYGEKDNGLTAMMRTTAFPAAIILEMLVDGRIKDRGVLHQELSVPSGDFMEEMRKRNIRFKIYEENN
jgi:saccharopine dehydrogenase-like NADP-dependent oxidoreductase